MSARTRSWWWRAARTPISDALRGRLSASLDWRHRLEQEELPEDARRLIQTVVKKTRLWRVEQGDVALELTAHFQDGLSSGRTAEQLAESFGDPAQAARLIRRAKKRNRSLAWKFFHRTRQAMGILVLIYLAMAIVAFSRHPSPDVDFKEKLNAAATMAPEEDQAWPLYRQLLLEYRLPDGKNDALGAWPGDRAWPEKRELLQEKAGFIKGIRAAALKPALGLTARHAWEYHGDDALVLFGKEWESPPPPSEEERWKSETAWSLFLPHLSKLKSMARLLVLDMRAAAAAGDGARLIADHKAVLGLARHAREQPFLINQLVSIALVQMVNKDLARALILHSDAFSDSNLRNLAHELATAGEIVALDYHGEQMCFMDLIQRVYSDDGKGNGRLTIDGMRLLERVGYIYETDSKEVFTHVAKPMTNSDAVAFALVPAVSALVAPRQVVESELDRIFMLMEEESRKPLWQLLHESSEVEFEMTSMLDSPAKQVYYLIFNLLPGHGWRSEFKAASVHMFNDALTVVLALELYYREQDSYPERLDELAPRWLPRVPLDASTGKPLLFRVVDGKPLLYGRGWDGEDDGGVVTDAGAKAWPRLPADEDDDSDWVFFPPPRPPGE